MNVRNAHVFEWRRALWRQQHAQVENAFEVLAFLAHDMASKDGCLLLLGRGTCTGSSPRASIQLFRKVCSSHVTLTAPPSDQVRSQEASKLFPSTNQSIIQSGIFFEARSNIIMPSSVSH